MTALSLGLTINCAGLHPGPWEPLAAGIVVVRYDRDFALVADITGQPMEWIVPAGTVP